MPATAQPKAKAPAPAALTIPQRLLLAARRLEEAGQCPFTAEALIVSAWKDSPQAFGLKGFEKVYPDANRTLACLMGERGLVSRGWFEKHGTKLYALSPSAREEADRLLRDGGGRSDFANGAHNGALGAIRLAAGYATDLNRLLACTAYARHRGKMASFITKPLADEFLALNPARVLPAARKALVGGVVRANGGEVTAAQLDSLEACRLELERRFAGRGVGAANGTRT